MTKLCINEKSLAEAATILKLWSSLAIDPRKQELIAPVIELLSKKRLLPGAMEVTFFITPDTPKPNMTSEEITALTRERGWPNGCSHPNSCARHKQCTYGCSAHKGRPKAVLEVEIDQAIAETIGEKKTPWELEPGVSI